MKIAHIIYAFPTGGTETMLVDIINEQAKYASISLIVVNNWYDKVLISKISAKVSVHLIKRKIGSRNPLPLLNLNYLLIKCNPDVIHCHDYSLAKLFLPIIKARKVLTIHDMNLSSKYHSKYDQLFAISEAVQNDITKNKFDSTVLYNGIKVNDILFKKSGNSKTLT